MRYLLVMILQVSQPLAVIVFIVSGLAAICLGKVHQGLVNLCIALGNFMIFYGARFFKQTPL